MVLPSIDIVIPTFNCASSIERCLKSLEMQEYDGKLEVIVVDGGSTDNTVEVCESFEIQPYHLPGSYGTGLTGARHYGERLGHSTFVWLIDSDNVLVETSTTTDLVKPLLTDDTIQLSLPETAIDPGASSFNNYLSLVEIRNVEEVKLMSDIVESWFVIDDLFYGITNGTLIRRSALELAGGYDSDVRLLGRLRALSLSKAAIVPSAHIFHNQTRSLLDFMLKRNRRMSHFASMTDDDLLAYFVEYPLSSKLHFELRKTAQHSLLHSPIQAIEGYSTSHDIRWLWGILYPFALLAVFLRHPIRSHDTLSRIL